MSLNGSGAATWTLLWPRTAMAFNFLEPITAAMPERPAARDLSTMIPAMFDSFSPGGPISAKRMPLSPISSRILSSVGPLVLPQRWAASQISTSSSTIDRYTGLSETPVTTIPSQPARLSSDPK